MSTPSPASARLQGRILGIDVARALAIVGMLAVHVGPTDAQGVLGRLYALPHGRASVLFVVVAGVGVTLLASSRRRALSDVRRELAWRSAVLLAAGLALQSLDHGVLVILQTYAPLFLVGAFAVGWSDVALLVAAAAMSLAGPALFVAGHALAPARYDRAAVRLTDGVAEIAHGIVLSGAYPLVVWVAPLLFGMWLGRRDLGTRATQLALVASGAVVAVGAWLLPRGRGSPSAPTRCRGGGGFWTRRRTLRRPPGCGRRPAPRRSCWAPRCWRRAPGLERRGPLLRQARWRSPCTSATFWRCTFGATCYAPTPWQVARPPWSR